jgi:peptidylprolyl isomerase
MKNIFAIVILIAVVLVGIWLFVSKGTKQTATIYDSAAPTVNNSTTPTATPIVTPTPVISPVGKLTKMKDGLQIQDEVIGTGPVANSGDTIAVQYTGTLSNGKKFDSSYDHGQPFAFQLGVGQVIKGWDEGVIGMKVGGKRKLIIPPTLAYGSQDVGNGLIPPNSTLIFEVELVGIQGK